VGMMAKQLIIRMETCPYCMIPATKGVRFFTCANKMCDITLFDDNDHIVVTNPMTQEMMK